MKAECQRAIQPEWGNNNTRVGEENTGKGCRGQVRRASIEARTNYDNSIVTMLICTKTHSNLRKKNPVSHHALKGTICPFLCIPYIPPVSSRPFRSMSEVTFPCHQSSLPHPCPRSFVTLVTLSAFPIFFLSFLVLMSSYAKSLEPLQ